MKEKLSEKHEREWEIYSILHTQALNDIIENELSIRKKYGMRDDHLPQSKRNEIERSRHAFTREWSAKGSQAATLAASQEKEKAEEQKQTQESLQQEKDNRDTFSEEEMDAMYADFSAAEKVRQGMLEQQRLEDQVSMIEKQEIEEPILTDISDLLAENDAIRNHYEVDEGREVPHATQQRMAKHLVTLRQEVDGTVPRNPLDKWRTMNDQELDNEAKSYEDLSKQHQIIRQHYGGSENVPAATKVRMTRDEADFRKELASAQQAKITALKENTQGIITRQEFREQLRVVRERNEQSVNRPKPG